MEIARGCRRGCRFCEAGFINRPYRERNPKVLESTLLQLLKRTGYEEVSLLSLSAGDYSCIGSLLSRLMDHFESKRVAVSFPSLRIEHVVGQLAREVQRVRKTGFTIAPEAGTDRLRKVINKEMEERVLFDGLSELFSKGWRTIKLYFMTGLPTETDEDVRGTIELARQILSIGANQRIFPNVNMSVSTFVPKPHTPFQWEPQIPLEEMKERLHFLKEAAKRNRIQFKWQDPHLSYLEGIFSRGDRRLSRVLIEAHRVGCRFDGWSDQFQFSLWREAFEKAGVAMDSPSRKEVHDSFPWSFIETGVNPSYLRQERQKARGEELTPSCPLESCQRCGVCNGETHRVTAYPVQEISSSGRTARERGRGKGYLQRIELVFSKGEAVRFISHLDLIQLFHRALRRADLPLRYSEGFHPLPRIVFARALPVGLESLKEVVTIELNQRIGPEEVRNRMGKVLPRGIELLGAREVIGPFNPVAVSYRTLYWMPLDSLLPREEADARIRETLNREEIPMEQERKGKKREIDLRPLLEKITVREGEGKGSWGVEFLLRSEAGKTAKPMEVMEAVLRIRREDLSPCRIIKLDEVQ
jgi:radical SAM-linked protein